MFHTLNLKNNHVLLQPALRCYKWKPDMAQMKQMKHYIVIKEPKYKSTFCTQETLLTLTVLDKSICTQLDDLK